MQATSQSTYIGFHGGGSGETVLGILLRKASKDEGHKPGLPSMRRHEMAKEQGAMGQLVGMKAGKMNREAIRNALSRARPMTPQDVSEIVGLRAETVRKHLLALKREGRAIRTNMGFLAA